MLRSVALVAVLLSVAGEAAAQGQPVRFPSVAVGSAAAGPEITGWLARPPGDGPFPAVILAHSCAGMSRHTEFWGRLLTGWGYVVVAPDSFGPRGEKNVCGRGGVVSSSMRAPDIAGALDFLKAQPFVTPGRIGLIGHSHGGGAAVRAVQASYGLAARGLKAAVAYYPTCSEQFDRDVALPLLILIGDKDDWTPAERCRRLQAAGFSQPDLVEAVYYPDARHSFDSKLPERTVTVASGRTYRLAYDPVAGPDAEARTKAFFAKFLK
ncbi:MAG: dienelactone hydrolase family protein [Enhydrobacter sp.]|nr:MAG: dienelactone hydrolase family protein [Enhydrobacter sp.]